MKIKAVKLAFGLFILSVLLSCKNQDWEFPDFDYTTCYFPWQYPVRTLVLGKVEYDNSGDLAHEFIISSTMGGVYENNSNRDVEFVLAPELVNNLFFEDSTEIKVLPDSYYNLLNDRIIIKRGDISGGVTVQLTDDFFKDSLSYTNKYVIPLKIVSADVDSVLRGVPNVTNPDPRVAEDWKTQPKDYTVFGIKYINKYHGNYLLRGKAEIKNLSTNEVSAVIYRNELLEKNIITPLQTRNLEEVNYSRPLPAPAGSGISGNYSMKIQVNEQGQCTLIKDHPGANYTLNGSGVFITEAESWGNKKRDVFYLDIQITTDLYSFEIKDSLVFRDNSVGFELFTPIVSEK